MKVKERGLLIKAYQQLILDLLFVQLHNMLNADLGDEEVICNLSVIQENKSLFQKIFKKPLEYQGALLYVLYRLQERHPLLRVQLAYYFVIDLCDYSQLKKLLQLDAISIYDDLSTKSSLLQSKESNEVTNIRRIATLFENQGNQQKFQLLMNNQLQILFLNICNNI